MINEIILMKGYGLYVWSAFSFTLISFTTLYLLIKLNLINEQNKFQIKFGLLDEAKIQVAKRQSTHREIIRNRINLEI
tara:strand:- start:236 stop:469 length:234 start_codon:yes stop_codon:yes gene_type:complete